MNKIVMAIAGGVLAGTLVTTQVAGPLLAQENSQKANIYQQLDLFGDIFERIRGQYVEEVDAADLIEAAIDGMLSSLDPHSSYLSPGRIWRSWHRSHPRRGFCQSRLADRRHPG